MIPGGEAAPAEQVQVTPLKDDVPPVRNTAIKVVINVNFNYETKRPEDEARRAAVDRVLARLNEDANLDGNRFAFPDGEASNLTLDFTFGNEGQPGNDRFTGSVVMNGWGWGYIGTFNSGQYPYSDPDKLVNMLTDQVYGLIHTGWHDSRKDSN